MRESMTVVVEAIERLDVSVLDRAGVHSALRSLAQIKGWHDACVIALTRRLNELAEASSIILPEAELASATNTSRRDATNIARRVGTLTAVPAMEPVLAAGEVSVEHVDTLGRALDRLTPEDRNRLATDGARLVDVASRTTPEQFGRHLRHAIARLDRAEAGTRLLRQKQACSFRSWTDHDTGMWCFHGELDPETGLRVAARLDGAVETLFHDKVPEDCPAGERKQEWLRARALCHLVGRRGATPAPSGEGPPGDDCGADDAGLGITELDNRVELLVVMDLDTIVGGLHAGSLIDNGHGLDLPVESYRRMACTAAIIPVVLDGNGVPLDLGRSQRLASRAQRRALRAAYRTCGIPGCTVSSRHCQPHHIRWWRHLGPTDLANLIPLCSRHHHKVHEGGWQLVMHPDRSTTITLPNGNTIHGPPPGRPEAVVA